MHKIYFKLMVKLSFVADEPLFSEVGEELNSEFCMPDGCSLVDDSMLSFEPAPGGADVAYRLVVTVDDGIDLADIVGEMDCAFSSGVEGVVLSHYEILDYEVLDSK